MTNKYGIICLSVGKADLLCQNAPEYARKVLTDFSTDSRNGAFLLERVMDKARCKSIYSGIKWRCSSPRAKYFRRGIRNYLTLEQVEYLWDRDKADLMKRPSVDRIDTYGNYSLENCRFIEIEENWSRPRVRGKCSVCGKQQHAHGLCKTHYSRKLRKEQAKKDECITCGAKPIVAYYQCSFHAIRTREAQRKRIGSIKRRNSLTYKNIRPLV